MAFISISKLRNAAGKAVSQAWGDDVVDDLEFLNGQIGTLTTGAVLNGSFEIASNPDEPNIPDNWTRTLFPGGTGVIDTTNPRYGAQAYKFTHPGGASNGGGQLVTDFIEITPDRNFRLGWTFWATLAGVHVTVSAEYFTAAQASISSEDLYDASAGNPTTATRKTGNLTVPATARYVKFTLVGGDTDVDPGASTDIYFDDILLDGGHNFETGSVVFASSLNETTTISGALAKAKEIVIDRDGDISTAFAIKKTGGGNAEGRIYVNGGAVGTLRINVGTIYAVYTEDITGLEKGDLVQLYIRNSVGGAGNSVEANDFLLKADQVIENAVSQEIV